MDRYGVSRAFMFCLDEPDRHPSFREPNDRTLAFAERSGGRLIPFLRLDLNEDPIEEARRCLAAGARGIKLHPRAQRFTATDERLAPVFEIAAEHRVPILIHGGRGLPPIAAGLRTLVERYPEATLIIAHAGIADLAELAACMAGRRGVLFDTSTWSPIDLLDFYRQIPPEQVVYASDYPYGQQPPSLLIAVKTARVAGYDDDQLRAHARRHRERARRRRARSRSRRRRSATRRSRSRCSSRASTSTSRWRRRSSGCDSRTRSASSGSRSTRAPSATGTRRRSMRSTTSSSLRAICGPSIPSIDDEVDQRFATRLDVSAPPPRGHRGGDVRCLSSLSTTTCYELRRARRNDPRRGAARRARRSPARRSRAARGTAVRAPCSSTASRRSRASRSRTRVRGREVTTIEGLREHPMVDSFVRADALQCGFCTPGQIVSAVALVEAKPAAVERGDPARDGGQPLPLRRVPEDRGGDPHVARLIRTEKEVEGRYEEVWLVVEEDALEQWPAGPREIVGRAGGPRRRLRARARRGASTPPTSAERDAAHRRAALAARARRGEAHRPARPRSPRRACTPRSAPARSRSSSHDCNYQGARSRPSAPTRSRRRAPRSRRSRSSGRCCEPLLDPDEAVRRGELLDEPRVRARGDYERGLAEADVVVAGEYRTAVVLHNSMETHQSVVQWVGDTVEVHISTQYIWGIRDAVAAELAAAARQGARDLPLHGRRLRLEERRRRLHVHRGRAREAHRTGPSGAR